MCIIGFIKSSLALGPSVRLLHLCCTFPNKRHKWLISYQAWWIHSFSAEFHFLASDWLVEQFPRISSKLLRGSFSTLVDIFIIVLPRPDNFGSQSVNSHCLPVYDWPSSFRAFANTMLIGLSSKLTFSLVWLVKNFPCIFRQSADWIDLKFVELYKLRSVQNTGTCYPGQGWFVRNLGWGR